MAHKINKVINDANDDDANFLVICSSKHMAYGFGVPERLWQYKPDLVDETLLVNTTLINDLEHKLGHEDSVRHGAELVKMFGSNLPSADICLLCEGETKPIDSEAPVQSQADSDMLVYYAPCPD